MANDKKDTHDVPAVSVVIRYGTVPFCESQSGIYRLYRYGTVRYGTVQHGMQVKNDSTLKEFVILHRM